MNDSVFGYKDTNIKQQVQLGKAQESLTLVHAWTRKSEDPDLSLKTIKLVESRNLGFLLSEVMQRSMSQVQIFQLGSAKPLLPSFLETALYLCGSAPLRDEYFRQCLVVKQNVSETVTAHSEPENYDLCYESNLNNLNRAGS